MAKCTVCKKEYNTAYEAFQCETKCREALDISERDYLYFIDIRMQKRSMADFEISADCRYERNMTSPPPKVEAFVIEPYFNPEVNTREEMITDIVLPGRLRCFQLEEGLKVLKDAWCDIVQKRLEHVLAQGRSKEGLGYLCEKFNYILQNIEQIDGIFWETLSEERHSSIRLGPVGSVEVHYETIIVEVH